MASGYAIYSKGIKGYWNDKKGWVEHMHNATVYTEEERKRLFANSNLLPNAEWVVIGGAKEEQLSDKYPSYLLYRSYQFTEPMIEEFAAFLIQVAGKEREEARLSREHVCDFRLWLIGRSENVKIISDIPVSPFFIDPNSNHWGRFPGHPNVEKDEPTDDINTSKETDKKEETDESEPSS